MMQREVKLFIFCLILLNYETNFLLAYHSLTQLLNAMTSILSLWQNKQSYRIICMFLLTSVLVNVTDNLPPFWFIFMPSYCSYCKSVNGFWSILFCKSWWPNSCVLETFPNQKVIPLIFQSSSSPFIFSVNVWVQSRCS